ncbi:hypothetical protein AN963_18350 [Brevibacillus choshinensis]|uniref:SnoaL-like domain-containing protein n=1 Tax=Brevibacillus choshinensis TaxID=54911 RepID=A0ABR5N8A0_BRECH|nr:DUF4440 domain-containing protein [Brevibacillus choshinensis]KQL46855.1 hypothetical protein AN963_18350 [Brevibacillus choshinensis]
MTDLIHQHLVMNPEDMNTAFARAYNSGDIDNLLALYEPNGILMSPQGSPDEGIQNIRKTLNDLLNLRGTMNSNNVYCIPFENIALLRANFTLNGFDASGNDMQVKGHTSEIVRRQPDGRWLYIVDHPFGANPLTERNGGGTGCEE